MTLINCRPEPQSHALAALLKSNNYTSYEFCPITIENLTDDFTQKRLHQFTRELDRFDEIIVTSQYAVEFGVEYFSDHWPQWPIQNWWAIGDRTADLLARYGINAQVPNKPQNSQSLLRALHIDTQKSHKPKTILIVTGKHGLGAMAPELENTGHQVTTLCVYERKLKTIDTAKKQAVLEAISQSTGVIITSQDIAIALENLRLLNPAHLSNSKFFVASHRIEQYLRGKGAQAVINCKSAANPAILCAIQNNLNTHN